jgi:hypothetical protein
VRQAPVRQAIRRDEGHVGCTHALGICREGKDEPDVADDHLAAAPGFYVLG